MSAWNPDLYQQKHSFVWEYGREVVDLLAPRAGERILDVGCGTGQLTAEIAQRGADVVGIDNSREMIGEARRNFPNLRFEVGDVCRMDFVAEFDGVFSNAALHWVRKAEAAAERMCRVLKPNGRLAVELGGNGNCQSMRLALDKAFEAAAPPPDPYYFPSLAEYAVILERKGFEVLYAALFDRPTRLEAGFRGWVAMFAGRYLDAIPNEAAREAFLQKAEAFAAPQLLRDGEWRADYRRLRIMARKV